MRSAGKVAEPLHRNASLLGRDGPPVFLRTVDRNGSDEDISAPYDPKATLTPFIMQEPNTSSTESEHVGTYSADGNSQAQDRSDQPFMCATKEDM
jgi:hypothetical protein